MRYAIVDASGIVLNVVKVEAEDIGQNWSPPEGCEAIHSTEAGIGWVYANGDFTDPQVS